MKHRMDFAVAQRPLFSKKATMMTAISQNTWVVNNVTNLFLMYYTFMLDAFQYQIFLKPFFSFFLSEYLAITAKLKLR